MSSQLIGIIEQHVRRNIWLKCDSTNHNKTVSAYVLMVNKKNTTTAEAYSEACQTSKIEFFQKVFFTVAFQSFFTLLKK